VDECEYVDTWMSEYVVLVGVTWHLDRSLLF